MTSTHAMVTIHSRMYVHTTYPHPHTHKQPQYMHAKPGSIVRPRSAEPVRIPLEDLSLRTATTPTAIGRGGVMRPHMWAPQTPGMVPGSSPAANPAIFGGTVVMATAKSLPSTPQPARRKAGRKAKVKAEHDPNAPRPAPRPIMPRSMSVGQLGLAAGAFNPSLSTASSSSPHTSAPVPGIAPQPPPPPPPPPTAAVVGTVVLPGIVFPYACLFVWRGGFVCALF